MCSRSQFSSTSFARSSLPPKNPVNPRFAILLLTFAGVMAAANAHAQSSADDQLNPAAASPYKQQRSTAYTSFDNPYAPGGIYDPYRDSRTLVQSQNSKSTLFGSPSGARASASSSMKSDEDREWKAEIDSVRKSRSGHGEDAAASQAGRFNNRSEAQLGSPIIGRVDRCGSGLEHYSGYGAGASTRPYLNAGRYGSSMSCTASRYGTGSSQPRFGTSSLQSSEHSFSDLQGQRYQQTPR
jgi:hypothetical protein